MSQTILGIDLGTFSIKVLLLERKVQELKVLDFLEEPVSLHARLTHEEQVVAVLQKFFANCAVQPDVICANLPGHLISSRIVTLPFSNSQKINQLADFELEAFIPFPLEDIFSDYHVLKTSPNESQVLCVYTQDESLRKYLDKMTEAGLEAKYFGAAPTDLAGIANIALVPHSGYYLICDIGHTGTNVLLMEGTELKYMRSIGIGGFQFTRAVQRAFNLNYEKAEALKMSRGKLFVREQDSDQVSRILNKVAMELVSAIKQTIWGAGHYYGRFNVAAIYCCGGGSRLVGMNDFLSFQLKVNVFELEALNFINHDFDDPETVNTIIPQVLASAVRPIYSNKFPRINYRKGPFAFKQDLQVIASEIKSVAVLLVLILILGITYYFYADHIYSKKMAAIDKQIDVLVKKDYKDLVSGSGSDKKRGAEKTKSLATYLKSAKAKLKELKETAPMLMGGTHDVVSVMYDISKALPPKKDVNFEVKGFVFGDDFVKLNASTNDTLHVETIVAALEKSGNFESVKSSDAVPKPGNIWDFEMKLYFKK